MGYYTHFTLYSDAQHVLDIEREAELEKILTEDDEFYFLHDHAKGYYWEEAIKSLSNKFPKVTFSVHGDGEDGDDIWLYHFKEGKKIGGGRAQISFEASGNEALDAKLRKHFKLVSAG